MPGAQRGSSEEAALGRGEAAVPARGEAALTWRESRRRGPTPGWPEGGTAAAGRRGEPFPLPPRAVPPLFFPL